MNINEINNDFYCSADFFMADGKRCNREICGIEGHCEDYCTLLHRKYPTPEQFKEEYGEEWTGAVYWRNKGGIKTWNAGLLSELVDKIFSTIEEAVLHKEVVCACTPFGKPDDDWRPK